MKQIWFTSVIPIAMIFSLRMFGLFMLIPIFTLFAQDLQYTSPTLIGIALGSYGLSQGLLQIPLAMLSDKIGRKPVITLGLVFLAIGSLLGAISNSIYLMILARILQGAGAIGSVLIALLADLTTVKQRTKAMAIVGMSIGISFSMAILISPGLANAYGLSSIFYLTFSLAILGIILLHSIIPTPQNLPVMQITPKHNYLKQKINSLKNVIHNTQLSKLNLSIFIQHYIFTATFYVMPLLLSHEIKRHNLDSHWHFYLPLLIGSFIFAILLIHFAEKRQQEKLLNIGAIIATIITQLFLIIGYLKWLLFTALLFIYFIGFNILEAYLPSAISKLASPNTKGTALGIYSSSQFLGIFIGGTFAGIIFHFANFPGIFLNNALISIFWLLLIIKQ